MVMGRAMEGGSSHEGYSVDSRIEIENDRPRPDPRSAGAVEQAHGHDRSDAVDDIVPSFDAVDGPTNSVARVIDRTFSSPLP